VPPGRRDAGETKGQRRFDAAQNLRLDVVERDFEADDGFGGHAASLSPPLSLAQPWQQRNEICGGRSPLQKQAPKSVARGELLRMAPPNGAGGSDHALMRGLATAGPVMRQRDAEAFPITRGYQLPRSASQLCTSAC
jgi:hypothetical protein